MDYSIKIQLMFPFFLKVDLFYPFIYLQKKNVLDIIDMNIIKTFQSPNFNERPSPINLIVLHYTDLPSIKESLDILCSLESKVSAHFLIDDNGDIYGLVPVEKRAWHAGVSSWQGISNVNDFSIGIELQNKGHSVCPLEHYPQEQMEALLELLENLCLEYNIPAQNIVGHSDVAPDRKKDPGEHFDWIWLNKHGYGKPIKKTYIKE